MDISQMATNRTLQRVTWGLLKNDICSRRVPPARADWPRFKLQEKRDVVKRYRIDVCAGKRFHTV